MTGLHSSTLRHRVVVQQQTVTQNPTTGELTTTWAEYGKRWAEYRASSVREFIAASEMRSEVKGRFKFRADAGIAATMRVLFRGKVYAILGVLPDPDSGLEYVTAPVSEGVIFDGR